MVIVVLIVTGLVRVNLSVNVRSAAGSDGVAQASRVESTESPLVIGVILSDPAAASGWGGLVPDNVEFVWAAIPDATAILYDRCNAADRPGVTLDWVVNAMIKRGASTIFIAGGQFANANWANLGERYPDTVFVINLAARTEVEALLPALARADLSPLAGS